MKLLMLGFAVGVSATLAALVSCGDDTPSDVDAATACDCPDAEPPLAGRVTVATQEIAVDADGPAIAGVFCPTGGTLLGGGCTLQSQNPEITLSQSGPGTEPNTWSCFWNNPTTETNTGIASAVCLVPPAE